ncbi:hypothetical protein C0J52_28182 [Blattella germanica]|nr:hypothetical protein C0J52_28182 [Blattella germanica]
MNSLICISMLKRTTTSYPNRRFFTELILERTLDRIEFDSFNFYVSAITSVELEQEGCFFCDFFKLSNEYKGFTTGIED